MKTQNKIIKVIPYMVIIVVVAGIICTFFVAKALNQSSECHIQVKLGLVYIAGFNQAFNNYHLCDTDNLECKNYFNKSMDFYLDKLKHQTDWIKEHCK